MAYIKTFITTFTKQEILQKLQLVSSGKKIKTIDSQTFSLYIRGIISIYRVKSNYRVKIVIKEMRENRNNVYIMVYPDFIFCFMLLVCLLLLTSVISSIDQSNFHINWYFLGIFIFFVCLNIYEFLDQRKRIINKIIKIIK